MEDKKAISSNTVCQSVCYSHLRVLFVCLFVSLKWILNTLMDQILKKVHLYIVCQSVWYIHVHVLFVCLLIISLKWIVAPYVQFHGSKIKKILHILSISLFAKFMKMFCLFVCLLLASNEFWLFINNLINQK